MAAAVLFLALASLAFAQGPEADPAAVKDLAKLGFTVFPSPQTIPAVVAATPNFGKIAVADLKGKYVFLNFWATWCPPCKAEMPSIEKLYRELAGDDFTVLAISAREPAKTVIDFLKKTPYGFPIGLDPAGTYSAVFAARAIPTSYILDRQGRAIAGITGSRDWATPEALAVFKALIAK